MIKSLSKLEEFFCMRTCNLRTIVTFIGCFCVLKWRSHDCGYVNTFVRTTYIFISKLAFFHKRRHEKHEDNFASAWKKWMVITQFEFRLHKTGVINDPLGQPTIYKAKSSSNCRLILKCWDGLTDRRAYGRTGRAASAKKVITTGRDCGRASWINSHNTCHFFANFFFLHQQLTSHCLKLSEARCLEFRVQKSVN